MISVYHTPHPFYNMKGDQRPTILGLSIAFPIISIVAVLLRFESRRVSRVQFGSDDWTILAALVRPSALLLRSIRIHAELVQLLTIGVTLDVLLGESA